jgi:hypothetical protein
MMRRMPRALRSLAVPACALALLAGCAAFVSKSDYADYRAVRMERHDDARLRAMQRYVARHPDGRWHGEVQRERARRDREVFEAGRSHRAGLELYLDAFPDGQFVGQAQSRLAAIEVIEQRKRDEAQRAAGMAEERRQRDDELSRTWVTRFFGYWIETLVSLQGWGSPIAEVARGNEEFSRAFGRPPRPRCTSDECIKYYESGYAIPIPGGTRLERAMRLVLRLRMDDGRLVGAELLMPGGGFSRWQELEERRVVVDGDPEARMQAITWALGRVLPLIDKLAPGHQPIENYALAQIPKLTFGPTGELTDTTAEDPSAPANRIQGSSAAPEPAPPSVEDLVKPSAPEAAPDLEMETLQVGKDGRAKPGQTPLPGQQPGDAGGPTAAPAGGEGGELILEPLAVPRADGTAPSSGPAPASPAASPAVTAPATTSTPPTVRAFRAGTLRIVVFAAGSADPAAFDGVLIERSVDRPAKAGAGKPKRPGTARPTQAKPAATPPQH